MSELSFAGKWNSEYSYQPGDSDELLTSSHVLELEETDGHIRAESLPQQDDEPDGSIVNLWLAHDPENRALTGTWREVTDRDGTYRGDVFHGTLQLLIDSTGNRAEGIWTGFNSDRTEIKYGKWVLQRVIDQGEPTPG